jgi:zinc protease
MQRFIAVCLFLTSALPVWSQENISTFQLDNGLQGVVIEDHRAPVVTHYLWIKAGAADETPGKSGIAHFLEHLLFKGTTTVESGEFSRVVESIGGSDNAFTNSDYTGYIQRVSRDHLETMMRYESDRMRNLVLTPEDVETERGVVIEERNQRTESRPGNLLAEQRTAAQYLNHPYADPIIGWRHEIDALSLDDAMDFYRKYYAPNNAILIVAGDVTPAEVEALAIQYYGPLEPTPGLGQRVRPAEPRQLVERRLSMEDPRVSQPYVVRSYLAPERDSGSQETAAALMLFSDLLGGDGIQSHLGKVLQIENSDAIFTDSFYRGLSYDDTVFGLVTVPAEGINLQDAEDAMDAAVAAFFEVGVDEDHLTRLKAQYKAQQIYALDSSSGQARRYGAALTSGLTIADVQEWPAIIQAVTSDDILAAGRAVLDRGQSVTAWLKKPQEDTQ